MHTQPYIHLVAPLSAASCQWGCTPPTIELEVGGWGVCIL